MLVTVRNSEPQHLLVDCGKTFEEAVLLTHGHADAILGLDSLREVQLAREPPSQWKLKAKTPIIATNDTVKEVWSHFHYLLPENSGEPTLRRRTSCSRSVSGLSPMRVTDFQNFQAIPGLQVQTVPVLHGGTYESSGFRFGARGEFVYLSATRPVQPSSRRGSALFLSFFCFLRGKEGRTIDTPTRTRRFGCAPCSGWIHFVGEGRGIASPNKNNMEKDHPRETKLEKGKPKKKRLTPKKV
ncbi:unnamed protein product [Effrenium voratum]|nr:unnamed protein product [Effrenium voratum]